jgi:putative ABC transport system substrate-binding protein
MSQLNTGSHEPSNSGGIPQFVAIQSVAVSFRLELSPVGLRNVGEIERAISRFAGSPNGGLIVTRLTETIAHRDLIIALAARYNLPAVYPLRLFATAGVGLNIPATVYARADEVIE